MKKSLPDFSLETELWEKGFLVIGVDEVGRGAFAGPVVAAAFAAAPQIDHETWSLKPGTVIVDDSKKLTSKQREKSSRWLRSNGFKYALGIVSPSVINRIGIAQASLKAMRRAVFQLINKLSHNAIPFVLSDYFHIPCLRRVGTKDQRAIVKGDQKCISIAAASILAKVERDNIMARLSEDYPSYQWERNKGYGTREHRALIKTHGATNLHREQFLRKMTHS